MGSATDGDHEALRPTRSEPRVSSADLPADPAAEMPVGDGADDSTHETVVALVAAEAEAWRRGDPDAAGRAFAADGRFVTPGGVWVGPEGVRVAMRAFLTVAEVVDVEVRDVFTAGTRSCVEWVWTERHHDGAVAVMEDAIVIDVLDGQIVRWREYFDPTQTAPLERVDRPRPSEP